jgi:tryptophan-rich sensory protein
MSSEPKPKPKTALAGGAAVWLALAGWVLFSFLASASGILFSPGEWYAQLRKPSWNPPGWLFGPVWTTLYAMMGVAAWLVWLRGGFKVQRLPLGLFIAQWVCNALWTCLFFGARNPLLGLIDIVILWVLLTLTLVHFWRVRPLAGALLVPYLLWISFAAALNFRLWQLNP